MSESYEDIPIDLIEFIEVTKNLFFVKKRFSGKIITFGKFNSLNEACAAASILVKNKWVLANVSSNPIINYLNEFWVFNVEDNRLVFDTKFSSFESAVEHVEINLRCNDYHNDVFRNSLNARNKYSERYVEHEEDIDDKYIFKKSNKFLVKKSKRRDSAVFGEFEVFDQACAAKKLLLESNWHLSDGNEITFSDNFYWVFEVCDGVLKFKGKSDSYEDALDIINSPVINKEYENPYIKSISENFDKVVSKPKKKLKKKKIKVKSTNKSYNYNIEHKSPVVQDVRIWKPNIKRKKPDGHYRIVVAKPKNGSDRLVAILDFNIFKNNVDCDVDGVRIHWNTRYDLNLKGFPEFQLIINILEVNNWDLNKIKNASSIYYFDNQYFKIRIIKDRIIFFNNFASYHEAEKTPLIYKGKELGQSSLNYQKDIDKVGQKFEIVKIQNGQVFKINSLKSLDEIKAVRDILICSNWNWSIFNEYDLFYLNGIYWKFVYSDYVVELVDKFESNRFI